MAKLSAIAAPPETNLTAYDAWDRSLRSRLEPLVAEKHKLRESFPSRENLDSLAALDEEGETILAALKFGETKILPKIRLAEFEEDLANTKAELQPAIDAQLAAVDEATKAEAAWKLAGARVALGMAEVEKRDEAFAAWNAAQIRVGNAHNLRELVEARIRELANLIDRAKAPPPFVIDDSVTDEALRELVLRAGIRRCTVQLAATDPTVMGMWGRERYTMAPEADQQVLVALQIWGQRDQKRSDRVEAAIVSQPVTYIPPPEGKVYERDGLVVGEADRDFRDRLRAGHPMSSVSAESYFRVEHASADPYGIAGPAQTELQKAGVENEGIGFVTLPAPETKLRD